MIIKRDIFSNIMSHIDKKEISLIIGPRQAGKTTLMKMIAEKLAKVRKENFIHESGF